MICRIIICVSKFAFSKSSCCDMYSTMMHLLLYSYLYSFNLDGGPQGLPSFPWKIQSHGKFPSLAITFIPWKIQPHGKIPSSEITILPWIPPPHPTLIKDNILSVSLCLSLFPSLSFPFSHIHQVNTMYMQFIMIYVI